MSTSLHLVLLIIAIFTEVIFLLAAVKTIQVADLIRKHLTK